MIYRQAWLITAKSGKKKTAHPSLETNQTIFNIKIFSSRKLYFIQYLLVLLQACTVVSIITTPPLRKLIKFGLITPCSINKGESCQYNNVKIILASYSLDELSLSFCLTFCLSVLYCNLETEINV